MQTGASFFQMKSIGCQTDEHIPNSNNEICSVYDLYAILSNMYETSLLLLKDYSIQFDLIIRSPLEIESPLQIKLTIKGPIFSVKIDFMTQFIQSEKEQIESIVQQIEMKNAISKIIQLEAKLGELDGEFTFRRAQLQYSFTGNFVVNTLNTSTELEVPRLTKTVSIISDDQRQSCFGLSKLKEQLIERYDPSEQVFHSFYPIEQQNQQALQPQQVEKCEYSRFDKDFCDKELIGSGGFGKVFKCRNKFDRNFYALKRIVLDYSNNKLTEKTKNEAVLLSRILHQNIVRYFQAWTEEYIQDVYEEEGNDDSITDDEEESLEEENHPNLNLRKGSSISIDEGFEEYDVNVQFEDPYVEEEIEIDWIGNNQDANEEANRNESIYTPQIKRGTTITTTKQFLYIQMEYCTGDTLKKKIDDKSLNSEQKKKIIRQILEALYYLHKNNIIHRDLKPQNIFLDGELNVKLGDFGLATEMKQEIKAIDNTKQIRNSLKPNSLTSGVGTFLYLAPEQEQSQYDIKVDIYSLGIIMFEMYYPFKTDMQRTTSINQLRDACSFPGDFIKFADQEIKFTITKLVNKDPKRRPTTKELLNEYKDQRILQVIRSIANPNFPDFNELVSTLFECKQLKSQNTFFTSTLEEAISNNNDKFYCDYLSNINELYNRVERIFKLRGGIKMNLSPLIPTQNQLRMEFFNGQIEEYESVRHINHSFRFITQEGGLVQYCQNLLQQNIYWIKILNLNNIRKYSFGEIEQANQYSLSKQNCATYDIIQENRENCESSLIELLSISNDIIFQFSDHFNFELKLSHSKLLELILLELGFTQQTIIYIYKHDTLLQKLIKCSSSGKQNYEVANILQQEFNFTQDKVNKLLSFIQIKYQFFHISDGSQRQRRSLENKKGSLSKKSLIETFKSYFTVQLEKFLTLANQVEHFIQLAKDIGLLNDIKVVFEVLQVNELSCYFSGIQFEYVEIAKDNNKLFEDIALSKSEPTKELKRHQKNSYTSYIIGGNYTHYLNTNPKIRSACGIHIYLDQIFYNKYQRYVKHNIGGTFYPFTFQLLPETPSSTVDVLILTDDDQISEQWKLVQDFWNKRISATIVRNNKSQQKIYKKSIIIRIVQKSNAVRCFIKQFKTKEEEKGIQETLGYITKQLEETENKKIRAPIKRSASKSRGGPSNQVLYDGDKKNSIRTYNDNINNRQGFKIGWDINQARKEDTKIAGKVGQEQRNSYIPSYQTQSYQQAEQKDDEYLRQLYQQELNQKQELSKQQEHQQQQQYQYQDALDKYNEHPSYQEYEQYQGQPQQQIEQSNKYTEEEQMYNKYKQGNSGSKPNYSAKPPLQQYNPINGAPYHQHGNYENSQQSYNANNANNAYAQQKYDNSSRQQQQYEDKQDDALSQFSQLQQHKVASMKNKQSNIFNTDLTEPENNGTRQNSRILNRKKEMDDLQYKGYGQFYKTPVEQQSYPYREQVFVNRNKVDNHIFPK